MIAAKMLRAGWGEDTALYVSIRQHRRLEDLNAHSSPGSYYMEPQLSSQDQHPPPLNLYLSPLACACIQDEVPRPSVMYVQQIASPSAMVICHIYPYIAVHGVALINALGCANTS